MNGETRLRSGGEEFRVTLAPDGDGFAARVGEAVHRVVCLGARAGAVVTGGMTIEEFVLEIDGRPCAALVARGRDRVLVALDGHVCEFESGEAARGSGGAAARGSGAVVAPMPGKIIAVLVAVGDTVLPGAPLVVLEAMKMESTLTAEVGGRVASVHAEPGAMVDAGTLLVEIVPTPA